MKRITLCALLITLFLLLGCGSGQQSVDSPNGGGAATGGRTLSSVLMELGRSAENVFYAFIELLSDTLGFTAKSTTKKNDVGDYFNSLGIKLEETSKELEEVAKKAETGIGKSDSSNKSIREAVNTAKEVLSTLKEHVESLGTVGDSNLVGDAEISAKQGVAADDGALKKVYNALKEIVKLATVAGVKALEVGTTTLSIDSVSNKEGAKILATSTAGAAAGDVAKAAIILTAVSGEEMLDSIVKSGESDAALSNNADGTTTAMSFARGGQAAHLAGADTPKAAAVAGGIALRSLVKTSKLAAGGNSKSQGGKEEVQKVGITAANKLLVAIEDVIKKTVKNVLEKAKEKIDEARNPKTAE
ncbi:variable large family protein (plasmid) [Borrelia puertoricensis]|uniref:variable large family protein n=1 Tax=Borrelia puertoricensis TaxID=2756107 RepID=UPI003EBB5529